jgi:hypothetical protein
MHQVHSPAILLLQDQSQHLHVAWLSCVVACGFVLDPSGPCMGKAGDCSCSVGCQHVVAAGTDPVAVQVATGTQASHLRG